MKFVDSQTIGEARFLMRDLVIDGHTCPVCSQFAKVYRRRIHSTMARELIKLYRVSPADWFHLPTIQSAGGDSRKLRYWGLLEEETSIRRDDGGRAGWWRLTDLGREWVTQRATVPKYAMIYDSHCLGLRGEPVGIIDALGTRFNYGELMAA